MLVKTRHNTQPEKLSLCTQQGTWTWQRAQLLILQFVLEDKSSLTQSATKEPRGQEKGVQNPSALSSATLPGTMAWCCTSLGFILVGKNEAGAHKCVPGLLPGQSCTALAKYCHPQCHLCTPAPCSSSPLLTCLLAAIPSVGRRAASTCLSAAGSASGPAVACFVRMKTEAVFVLRDACRKIWIAHSFVPCQAQREKSKLGEEA